MLLRIIATTVLWWFGRTVLADHGHNSVVVQWLIALAVVVAAEAVWRLLLARAGRPRVRRRTGSPRSQEDMVPGIPTHPDHEADPIAHTTPTPTPARAPRAGIRVGPNKHRWE